jgi:hypothetical protein
MGKWLPNPEKSWGRVGKGREAIGFCGFQISGPRLMWRRSLSLTPRRLDVNKVAFEIGFVSLHRPELLNVSDSDLEVSSMVDGNAWGTKQIPCVTRPMQIRRLELKLMA